MLDAAGGMKKEAPLDTRGAIHHGHVYERLLARGLVRVNEGIEQEDLWNILFKLSLATLETKTLKICISS